jgi:primosomal protein N'
VLHLLIEENADPTESYKGKLPYVVSKDKETRDAFRRAMAQKPDAWDWIGRAAVPSALTEELEAKKAAKEAEYEAARKEKEKERKKAQKERKKKQSAAAALLEKTAAPASSGVAEKKSAALVEQVDKVSNDRREQMVSVYVVIARFS